MCRRSPRRVELPLARQPGRHRPDSTTDDSFDAMSIICRREECVIEWCLAPIAEYTEWCLALMSPANVWRRRYADGRGLGCVML